MIHGVEMSITLAPFFVTGILFLIIFVSGLVLRRSGKPYNAIILTTHKLISLAAVYFLATTIIRVNRVTNLTTIELATASVTGLFFLSAIISGGLVSADKPKSAIITMLHKITPYLTLISTALALFLL